MRVALTSLFALTALMFAQGAAAAEPAAVCPAFEASVDAFGQAAVEAGAPGLVVGVARPGQAPLVRAFGQADVEHATPMQPGSVFRIASLTKQFTAALVLDLVEEGRLELEDRAAEHLPELTWLGEVTVEQLLLQTSGLPDYAQDPSGEAGRAAPRSSAQMLEWIGRLAATPDFAPGERWAYSNSNYAVLGALAERLTGQTFAEAMAARVLGPAGLRDTAVDDPLDLVPGRVRGYSRTGRPSRLINAAWIHPSTPGPAGSLRSTAADLLRWNAALYGGAVLEPATLARMTVPGRLADGRTTRHGMPPAWREGLKSDYALGLFVSGSPLGPRLWHSGDVDGFVTWMAHYPEAGTTVVLLQNGDFADLDHAGLEALLAAPPC